MNPSMAQVLAAAGMLAVVVVLVFGILRYQRAGAEQRMRRMLQAVGLDPEIATSGDIETIMKDVRYRCRECSSEATCERWLAGKEEGGNEFCPNHRVFEILGKYGNR